MEGNALAMVLLASNHLLNPRNVAVQLQTLVWHRAIAGSSVREEARGTRRDSMKSSVPPMPRS